MRRAGFRVLAFALVSLLGAELALRAVGFGDPPVAVLDDELEYRLVPDKSYRRWGNLIAINRHGFRFHDLAPDPDPGERRILLLGDSVVYGNHFLDQSETLAYRLSELLTGEGCRVQAIPMALSSWGPENQLAALQRFGTLGATDAVLVFSGHDVADVRSFPPAMLPYRLSPPFGAVGDAIKAVHERVGPRVGADTDLPFERRVERSLTALDNIQALLSASETRLYSVYNRTSHERTNGMSSQGQILMHWAEGHAIPFVDLAAIPQSGYRDTIHPNSEGAMAIARRIADLLDAPLSCDPSR